MSHLEFQLGFELERSRTVLVGCGDLLLEPRIAAYLDASPFTESDETCRRMAAGLIAACSKALAAGLSDVKATPLYSVALKRRASS